MDYLYYLLYKFILRTPSKDEAPEYIAAMALAYSICSNLLMVTLIFYAVSNKDIPDIDFIYFIVVYGIVALLFIGRYIYKKRFLRVNEKYNNQKNKSKFILGIVYFALTLILLILAPTLRDNL